VAGFKKTGGPSARVARIGVHVLGVAAAAAGFALLLLSAAWVVRPEATRLSVAPIEYTEDDLRTVEAHRDLSFDPAHPLTLVREVDYSEREGASWYPKGEAPILAELAAAGDLPRVAERVGPEPVVVEGVDGIGAYGGTWLRLANSDSDVGIVASRFAYSTLVRWSPQGYPIVPHLARRYEVSPDNREFTFVLRRGVRWSDGHPFTADDVLYWWEQEMKDPELTGALPTFMTVQGKPGRVEKLDAHRVRIVFPEPYGLFLARMAGPEGMGIASCPAHYLRPYHPKLGDQALIEKTMRSLKLQSPLAVYRQMKGIFNPEHPRLWPWVYRTYKPNPPQTFVRNPYYYMVDTEGNQLPYVDRLLLEVVSPNMIPIRAANGDVTMQGRHINYNEYTHLMSQRAKTGYEVYHWYCGDRSTFLVSPNLNLKPDPARPEKAKKRALLNDKRFRQALSLAMNRADIIDAEFNGQTEAAQNAPGPVSSFYEPSLYHNFTEHDPQRANTLLDDIGLTRRDYEGYRTFADGSRMTFFLNFCGFTGGGPAQFIVDDWGTVGIRAVPRSRSRQLFYTEKAALDHDFNVWSGNSEFMPILEPRHFVPVNAESNFAIGFAKWFARGGLYDDPLPEGPGCIEPPPDHPIRRAMEVYAASCATADPAEQQRMFRDVLRIAAENVWTINACTPPPTLMIVKDGFRNVPRTAVATWMFLTPGNAGIETYYFDEPYDSPGAIAQMKAEVRKPTPRPDAVSAVEEREAGERTGSGRRLAALLRYGILATLVLALVAVGLKHPYIGRRLALMVPTLLIISVVSFTIIQLPPGDYVTTRIMQLQESGDAADLQILEDLKEMFYLEDPVVLRYARWLGLGWFRTFDAKDSGLLQGNMGRSMETSEMVNDIVGDRILLTVLISLGTILFTWATAIPIGIYSAVRQYSIGDYLLTFIGFIGMCVPSFLLALMLMYFSSEVLGVPVSGLFSSQYGAQPEWTWGKVADLLEHIWVPVVVLGVGGTAGMIRVMRANLLDELKKPYVITAMAKGVRPVKLLFKYPVRLALNPFISGIGGLFPMLVSGGAIVAMVLSLPTVGPLMLSALMSEDMYMAGSMLMVLSLLGVFGTLVSDLLLLWLDPRIRFKGGAR